MKILKNERFKKVTLNKFLSEIPENWQVKKIREITLSFDNKRKPLNSTQRSKMKGSYPYWGSSNIVDYINDYLIDEEVVLLGEDAAPFFDKSRPVSHISKGKIWPNNHIHILKALENSFFLKSYLNYIDYNKIISIKVRPKLTKTMMDNIDIALPPLKQQENIAYVLSTQEEQIERIKGLIKKLEKRNQYYAEKLLSGELRIRENQETGKIEFYENEEWQEVVFSCDIIKKKRLFPIEWEKDKLLNNIKLTKGISINSSKFNYENKGFQFLRTGDVWEDASSKKIPAFYDNKIEDKFLKNKYDYISCFEGFNKIPKKGTIGLVTNNGVGIISSHLYKTENMKINGKYIAASLLNLSYIQDILMKNAIGSTVLSSTKCLKDIEFLFPDKEESIKIEKILSNLFKEVEILKELLPKEEKRFQWMLDNLLSGEYEVVEE